jgi:antibiotic biosynthesis monooxygenase (ABM) superfamily enzyme
VAWADGSLDSKERQALLDRAEKSGIAPGTANHDLLRSWLEKQPEPRLLTAWTEMVRGLSEHMSPQELASLKAELMERAKAVARASGGYLGMGAVSIAEQNAIDRLETAFRSA